MTKDKVQQAAPPPTLLLNKLPRKKTRPSWAALRAAYPKSEAMASWFQQLTEGWFGADNYTDRDELVQRKLGFRGRSEAEKESGLKPGSLDNTCALRFSAALNGVKGHQLKNPIRTGGNPDIITFRSRINPYYFIISSFAMRQYLEQTYGKPEVFIQNSDPKNASPETPSQMKGVKGIVLFWGMDFYDYAGGHADLWDGEVCVGNQDRYFQARQIRFWALP